MPGPVRRATVDDRARAVRTATRAFADDPLIRWFFPDDATYEERAGTFFGLLFDLRVDAGEVWCTDDGVAVGMWDAPGGDPRGLGRGGELWDSVVGQFPADTRARFERMGAAVHPHHLTEHHWYLGILATHPDWQRQGLGGAVMAPVLTKADVDGFRCMLMTETPENVAYYRKFGFEAVAEPEIDDGPHVWLMRREPSRGGAR